LVSRLWQALACPSPMLMSVMFTCAARRLHHDKDILWSFRFLAPLESFKICPKQLQQCFDVFIMMKAPCSTRF
jgi:hypothetical protein